MIGGSFLIHIILIFINEFHTSNFIPVGAYLCLDRCGSIYPLSLVAWKFGIIPFVILSDSPIFIISVFAPCGCLFSPIDLRNNKGTICHILIHNFIPTSHFLSYYNLKNMFSWLVIETLLWLIIMILKNPLVSKI